MNDPTSHASSPEDPHTPPPPGDDPWVTIQPPPLDSWATAQLGAQDSWATRMPGGATQAPDPSDARAPAGYAIERELGRGGMGVVYLARDVALRRPCALKMILAGVHSSPAEVERFRIEAQAIARLQHPAIVQVFEIGEHGGKPFMALEFCPGGALDAMLAKNPLASKQAATLVKTLAEAIHVAHQAKVLHRDLKPANVLLTDKGEPKITDFGLAKKLDEESVTRTGSMMGTPSYMPPEQAQGKKDIGPTADVYALGAILYECLASRPPFRAATPWDTIHQLLKEEAVPLRQLNAEASVDLETICAKCLQKDPNKRYATAQALADDLGRYLKGEPILARPVGPVERLWKWVRRQPTMAALLAVSLIAVAGAVWYNGRLQGTRAEIRARSELARSAADAVAPLVEQWLDAEPGQDPLQQEILEKALRIYQALAGEKGDDPSLRQATACAQFRCGQIYRRLGVSPTDAEKAYDEAIRIQESLIQKHPSRLDYGQDLANSYNDRGELLRETHRAQESLTWYDRALRLQQELISFSNEPVYRKDLARSEYNRALALRQLGQPKEALADLDRAAAQLDPDTIPVTDEPAYAQELARIHLNRAAVLLETTQTADALQACQLAIDLQRPLTKRYSKPDYRYELAVSLCNLASTQRASGDPKIQALAPAAYREACGMLTALTDQYPTRLNYSRQQAFAYNGLGAALCTTDLRGAEEAWVESARLFERLVEQNPERPNCHFGASQALGNLGWLLLWKRDKPRPAQQQLEHAARHLEHPACQKVQDPTSDQTRALVFGNLAEADLRLGDHKGSAEATERFLKACPASDPERYGSARSFARCLALTGEEANLHHYAERAVELLRSIDPRRYSPKDDPNFQKPLASDEAFRILRGRPEFARIKDRWAEGAAR